MESLFEQADKDKSGVVEFAEFVWLLGALVQDYRIQSSLADELAAVEPQLRAIRQQEAESRSLAEKIRLISRGQEGLATIGTAIETLKVAEHLTPILTEQLL